MHQNEKWIMCLFIVIALKPALPDREIELGQPTTESKAKIMIECSYVI